MPRTPRLPSGAAQGGRGGGVGRLRVSADQQAFGGGQGLARLGQGVSNLGAGLRAVGEAQDARAADKKAKDEREAKRIRMERQGFLEREKAEEMAQQEAIDKADAKQKTVVRKLEDDGAKNTYEALRQQQAAALKQTKGIQASDSVKKFDEQGEKARAEVLKGIDDPIRREQLNQKLIASDSSKRGSLFEHQGTEISKAARANNIARKENLSTKIIEGRNNMRVEGDDMSRWMKQWIPDTADAFQPELIMGGEKVAKTEANKFLMQNSAKAVDMLIEDMEGSVVPDADVERIDGLIDQFKKLGMPSEDVDELRDSLKKKREQIRSDAKKIQERQDSEFMSAVTSDFENISSQGAYWLNRHKEKLQKQNPDKAGDIGRMAKKFEIETPAAVEKEWTDALMQAKDVEEYKRQLTEAYQRKGSEIANDTFKALSKASDVKADTRKKAVWDDVNDRLKQLTEGVDVGFGKGELRADIGKLGSDLEIDKDALAAWNRIKRVALDPNVTASEFQQIADAALFKPEAEQNRMNMEQRVKWARGAFESAAILPGTQGINETNVKIDSMTSDAELARELAESMGFKAVEPEKVKEEVKERSEVESDARASVLKQLEDAAGIGEDKPKPKKKPRRDPDMAKDVDLKDKQTGDDAARAQLFDIFMGR